MLISYNLEKLKNIILDFNHLTGISIAVYDTHFNKLAAVNPPQENFFCNLIRSSPEGDTRCNRSDCELLEKCAMCKHLLIHNCHAGITDAAVPIFINSMLMGFIIVGQVGEKTAAPRAFSEIYEKIKDLGLDYRRLKQSYESLTFFDRPKIDSAVKVVSMLTQYIWFENMIHPDFNSEFEKLIEYVGTNLDKPLKVSDLCHQFSIPKNELYKAFHQHFNCTVNDYVSRLRLTHAEQLLKTTQLPIYEICEQCGFNDPHYFCRWFKKEKGVSPLQYRKQYLQGHEYKLHSDK